MKTDTPETDAQLDSTTIENEDSCCSIYVKVDGREYEGGLVSSDFARKLERERDAFRHALERIQGTTMSHVVDRQHGFSRCREIAGDALKAHPTA